jgi:hypothetical protein
MNTVPGRKFALVAALAALTLSACSNDDPGGVVVIPPGAATISGDITTNRTLVKDTTYTISGFVHVANGATLTIPAGTKIVGDQNVLGSSLFILRGARIVATGTAAAPIVFTSARAAGQRQPGDWGGLVIVGNGVINRSGTILVEGTGGGSGPGTNYNVQYSGGNNNADNSGTLQYVRVEFAGYAISDGNELNSFTFAAVGSGTTLDHLESMAGLDDSFEFFGGAVDGKFFVSYESGDDHFDMSEGYVGRLQFLIGLQTRILTPRPGAGLVATDPQGVENDGCNGPGCDLGFNSAPLTVPMVANFTIIGRGDPATNTSGGELGMVLRRGTGGFYVNGVLGKWTRGGISVRDADTQARIATNQLAISNILVADAPAVYQTGQQSGVDAATNNLILSTSTTASLFTALPATPSSASQLDWSPSATSAIRTGGLATFTGAMQTKAGTFVTGTAYRGAADPNGPKWWEGWTNYTVN